MHSRLARLDIEIDMVPRALILRVHSVIRFGSNPRVIVHLYVMAFPLVLALTHTRQATKNNFT